MPRANTKQAPRKAEPRNIHSTSAKGYRYIDKDPDMDVIKTIIDQSGLSHQEIAAEAKVSLSTLKNWEFGKTRRPQNRTLTLVAGACGWERRWVKIGGRR